MKLEFQNVTKKYGTIIALNNVSFTLDSGEFLFLVGPSGAGKSTIVRLILNEIKPTSGQILIDNQVISHKNSRLLEQSRKNIGVIFQDYQLIQDKTVEENIAVALDITNCPPSQINHKIDEVLKKVGMTSRRHLFPSQLSGGELQRTSLARALVVDPKIILADEPTGNLDPENTWNLIKLLKDINENSHVSILMTTHNYEIIEALDKRVITLKNGNIYNDSSSTVNANI